MKGPEESPYRGEYWELEPHLRGQTDDGRTDGQTDRFMLPGRKSPNFIPLVYEHFGGWGEAAEDYMYSIKDCSQTDDLVDVDFTSLLKNRLVRAIF